MNYYSITLSWHGKCFFPGAKKHFVVKTLNRVLVKKIPTAAATMVTAFLASPVYAADTHMDWLNFRHDYRSEFIVDETRDRAVPNNSAIAVHQAGSAEHTKPRSLASPSPIPIFGETRKTPQHLTDTAADFACHNVARKPLQSGWVSSGYGMRKDPFGAGFAFHRGVDLAAETGTNILAPAPGVVHRTYVDKAGGNWIELKHQDKTVTRFGHLSRFVPNLAPGDQVDRGQTIGYVGNTGLSTGPHLHYEILRNGSQQIDPLDDSLPLSLASCTPPAGTTVARVQFPSSVTYGGY